MEMAGIFEESNQHTVSLHSDENEKDDLAAAIRASLQLQQDHQSQKSLGADLPNVDVVD